MYESIREVKNRNVLVTGGTGFIGSNLVHKLAKYQANVYVLHRCNSVTTNLDIVKNKITLIEVDPLNKGQINKMLKEITPEYVFHLAQPSGHSLDHDQFSKALHDTTKYLVNLLDGLAANVMNLKSFVHACSSTIYKWTPDAFILAEDTAKEPATLRGLLKLNERNICTYFSKTHNIPVRLARIFRAYGPFDSVNKLIITAFDSLRTSQPLKIANDIYKRDYLHVDDLLRGLLLMAHLPLPSGIEINFGGGQQYSASDIIKEIELLSGQSLIKEQNKYPKNVYDRGAYQADIHLAKRLLRWEPLIGINEGLKLTLAWYRSNYE